MILNSIYIIHDNNHWVLAAYFGQDVIVADSLKTTISPYVQKQLKQLFVNNVGDDGSLTVRLVSCDKQQNSNDCGVYAAAFGFELAVGRSLSCLSKTYATQGMRKHLEMCLENQTVIPFPAYNLRGKGRLKTAL